MIDSKTQKDTNRNQFVTSEEFDDPNGFAAQQIFSPIDSDKCSVYSDTSLTSELPAISMSKFSESLYSRSTATSVWTPFSGISDISPDFCIGQTIRSDYNPKDFDHRLATKTKDRQHGEERTCSPGWQESIEESSDNFNNTSEQTLDFVNKSNSSEGLSQEKPEENCIRDYGTVELGNETSSGPKIKTWSDMHSSSYLWADVLNNDWRCQPSIDNRWNPDNYMPSMIQHSIPNRQIKNWNGMKCWTIDNWDSSDWYPYVVGSADFMKPDEIQENLDLNVEKDDLIRIGKDLVEGMKKLSPLESDQTVIRNENVEEVSDQTVVQNVMSMKSEPKVLSVEISGN